MGHDTAPVFSEDIEINVSSKFTNTDKFAVRLNEELNDSYTKTQEAFLRLVLFVLFNFY